MSVSDDFDQPNRNVRFRVKVIVASWSQGESFQSLSGGLDDFRKQVEHLQREARKHDLSFSVTEVEVVST